VNGNEYKRQLKRLIKIYHPDLCNNSYLKTLYSEITIKLVNKLHDTNKNNIDDDYRYYKLGIKYYKNIHPDQFYRRNLDKTFETKKYDELLSALNNIYLSFNMSEYYFKKVTEEYPNSQYFEDANAKIILLKKLFKSYENIVFSGEKIVDSEKFMNEMELKML